MEQVEGCVGGRGKIMLSLFNGSGLLYPDQELLFCLVHPCMLGDEYSPVQCSWH